jgi:hypothetical protein
MEKTYGTFCFTNQVYNFDQVTRLLGLCRKQLYTVSSRLARDKNLDIKQSLKNSTENMSTQ